MEKLDSAEPNQIYLINYKQTQTRNSIIKRNVNQRYFTLAMDIGRLLATPSLPSF